MISKAVPPVANENSPTPKADIPLFPPHPASTNPILDLLTTIQKQLERNESRLTAIENQSHEPTWDATSADPCNEDGYLYGDIADIDYLHPTPEQLELLQQKEEAERAEYYQQLDAEEQHRMNVEEQAVQQWNTLTPEERAEAILAKGGSEAEAACQHSIPTYINPLTTQMGVCTSDPIHVHSTQLSVNPPAPTRNPISHLVPDHGRKPIPSLVWCPNPPQSNALPTIGGSSYANQAMQQLRQSPSAPHQPARQVTSPTPKPTLTEAQLHARTTTKAVIVQNARDTFNA
jgi:hypothetical protein